MKKIVKLITLVVIFLNTFLTHAGDIPTAAKIVADAFKDTVKSTNPLVKESLATWQKTMLFHVDTRDLTKSTELLAQVASKLQLPAEFVEFLNQTRVKIDSEHFQNPTFHLGESTQKALVESVTELRKAIQALNKLEMGLNPHTAALVEKIAAKLEKLDPTKFPKISEILDKDITLNHRAEIAIEPHTGFVVTGIITAALASVIAGLIANKHISKDDAPFTQADKVATCASVALAIGAWALIKYSAALAGAA